MLNPRYILLSIIATSLIALGLLAKFFPAPLSALGSDLSNQLQGYWLVLIGLGVTVGAINALTLKTAKK